MTDINTLIDILANPKASTETMVDDVVEARKRYPYFTLPAALLLRNHADKIADEALRNELTQSVAMTTSDPTDLYILLEGAGCDHASFYPEEKPATPTTDSAIDTFLNTYGSTSAEEEQMLERLIFNPTPDYAQLLSREEEESIPEPAEAPEGSQDDLLNKFIIKQKQSAGVIPEEKSPVAQHAEQRRQQEPPQPAADDTLLSESLAKIFIRQRHYQQAYEIISQLSLNYPKKSVYFADQLRFLRKLINNQHHKEQSK
jgi:hypothetical protein